MTKAYAVIGANFGDEGKGRTVDYLCRTLKRPTIVVRHNGGPQAGHTVVVGGERHVMGHICSGAIAGCDSFLSHRFLANPYMFARELRGLAGKGMAPLVFMDQYTPLTTLYDMLLNREVETIRAGKRHGSCGYGVSETVERLCKSPFKVFFHDIGQANFEHCIHRIRDDYVPKRLEQLGITKTSDWFRENLNSTEMLSQYLCEAYAMAKYIARPTDPKVRKSHHTSGLTFLLDYKNIVFEGAQGLCLDERRSEFFPHLTRSKTGLSNAVDMCKFLGIKKLVVFYVTRAYLTRHGAGPLPTEDTSLWYEDLTNVENEWQGPLRFGYLDLDLLKRSIEFDQSTVKDFKTEKRLAITCMDQVGDRVMIKHNDSYIEIETGQLPGMAKRVLDVEQVAVSSSPEFKEWVPA